MFLMVAFFEESTLRGYLQFTLTRGIGFWWGALLLSLLFGFSHGTNPGETPVGLFAAAGVGLVFCLSLWYTGSLWWAVGFHASWDWAESYFYGTSDSGLVVRGHLLGEHPIGPRLWSGGTTGPEGSLLVLALLVIMALLMWLWWGRRVRVPLPQQRLETGLELERNRPRDPESLPAAFRLQVGRIGRFRIHSQFRECLLGLAPGRTCPRAPTGRALPPQSTPRSPRSGGADIHGCRCGQSHPCPATPAGYDSQGAS